MVRKKSVQHDVSDARRLKEIPATQGQNKGIAAREPKDNSNNELDNFANVAKTDMWSETVFRDTQILSSYPKRVNDVSEDRKIDTKQDL